MKIRVNIFKILLTINVILPIIILITFYTILKSKDIILNNVENNIEKTFNNQIESIEKTNSYINNWKEFYNKKDFEGMEKEYSKLENELNKLVPIENLLKEARTVENLHNLIKNNGHDFNLTQEQIELSNKL